MIILPRHARPRHAQHAVDDHDFAEGVAVVALERFAAAFEVTHDAIEFLPRQRAKRITPAHQRERFVGRHRFKNRETDEVLREDVEWVVVDFNRFERTTVHHAGGHGAFDEVVDVTRDEQPAAGLAHGVTGATDPLQRAAHAFGRRHHDDEIDRADIDAHLKRRRTDDRAQLAAFEAILDLDAQRAVERGVVDFDLRREVGQDFLEAQADRLGAAAGVGEDERRAFGAEHVAEFAQHACRGVAGGWVGVFAQRRKHFDVRQFTLRNFYHTTRTARSDEKFRHGVERRDCR